MIINKKNFVTILSIFSTSVNLSAQAYWRDMQTLNTNKPQVNKPVVSGLSAFQITDDNVDLSTGIVRPNINITEITTKSLREQITLTYNKGNGIKVNDISNDIGLGWELEAGGYITRKVNGYPDESTLYNDATVGVWASVPTQMPNKQKSANGWLDYANWNSQLYNNVLGLGNYIMPGQPYNDQSFGGALQGLAENIKNNVIVGSFRSLWAQPISSGTSFSGAGSMVADLGAMFGVGWHLLNVDGEPDEFYFHVEKYSGKFVFDGNRNPVTIPYIPGLKIQSPFKSAENKWIITTPEGVKYSFPNTSEYTEKMYSETETTPEYDNSWGANTPDRNEGIDVSEYTSKWYLSKVEGINGDYINYTYESLPDLIYNEKSFIKQIFRAGWGMTSSPPSYFLSSGDPGFYERELPRNTDFRLKSPKRLAGITTSDNNRVSFIYNGLERQDIDQSQNGNNKRKSLSSIETYDYNNRRISKMNFNQNYFTGTCNDYKCKRLKLNNLTFLGFSDDLVATTSFEYNIIENLPSRNAFQQDFWGYYNDNTAGTLVPEVKYPDAGYDYPGANRRPSENKAKANILTKIIYPTKGSIEYEYELNNFNTGGETGITDNKTGGLRIKNIIKKEKSNATPIQTTYQYLLTNGQTSGEVPAHLLETTGSYNNNAAGRPYERQVIEVDENTGARSQYTVIYSNPKYLYTDDLIRYSRVIINTNGKGKKEYSLSSFSTHPDDEKIGRIWKDSNTSSGFVANPTYVTNYYSKYASGSAPTIHYPSKSYLRGLILNSKEVDNNNILIKETINNYQINPSGYIPSVIYGLGVSSSDIFLAENARIKNVNYELTKYTSDYVYLNNSTTKDYPSNNNSVNSIQNNIFNNLCLLNTKSTLFPDNNLIETNYKYSNDKQVQKLINANIVGIPLEIENKRNGKMTNKTEIRYDNPSNLLPTSILSYDLQNNTSVQEMTYDVYDNKGNLLQYTMKDGVPVTMVWGYNQTLPIATIEGATYSQVMQAFGLNSGDNSSYLQLPIVNKSNLDIDDASESILVAELNIFRNKAELKDFRISTYTYNPLIGVTSITPPSGIRENYKYDSSNKLEKVIDITGKILKEYKYNYAPMIFYSAVKSQSFTTTNCAPGTLPVSGMYTVPAALYSSTISQADADQKAQNDINTNGQNYVNSHFNCTPYVCTITPTYLADIYYSSFQEISTNHIKAILSLPLTNSSGGAAPNWSNGVLIGTLDTLCRPNSYKSISVSTTNGSWNVSISPSGGVTLMSTSSSNPSGSTTLNFEYDK